MVEPKGVVTLMGPEVTPAGAVADRVVLFATEKVVAGMPLKDTALALVKFRPLIWTIVPAAPFVGVKLVMLAGKKKSCVLLMEPFVVVMVMKPEVAVAGTLNVRVLAEIVPNVVTVPLPTVTSGWGAFSFKPAPLMVISVFEGPDAGEKLKIVGSILKLASDWAGEKIVPAGGEIIIGAVDTLLATVARIVVLLEIIKLRAGTPPKATAETAVKFTPVITTFVFGRPLAGEKLVIAGATKKFVAEVMTLLEVLKLCVGPNLDIKTRGPEVTAVGAVTVMELSLLRTGVVPVFLETTPLNMTFVIWPV